LGNRIKYIKNSSGSYFYLRTPDKDILINKDPVRAKDATQLTNFIDSLERRLNAHKRYKVLLNNMINVFGESRLDPEISDMIRRTLEQNCDLES